MLILVGVVQVIQGKIIPEFVLSALMAHSQKVGTIIEKFKFRQTHVRMGLKPHATYGEKDAKAPSKTMSNLSMNSQYVCC